MKEWIPPASAKYLGIGLQLTVSVLAGVGAGYFIDKKLHTMPGFTMGGLILGFGIGLYLFLKEINADEENQPPNR